MKKSELKAEIKEYIVEILSEVDENTYVGAGAVADIQKDPLFAKIKDKPSAISTLKAGESVTAMAPSFGFAFNVAGTLGKPGERFKARIRG